MAEFLNEYILENGEQRDQDNSAKDDNPGTILAKVVAMICLCSASFIMGILPIKLSKWFKWESNSKSKNVTSIFLCFGGGVLLCTTFLHLLPEVSENIKTLIEKGVFPKTKINFAEFLMCIGFFTMYLIEECVHFYLHRRIKNNELNTFRRSLSIRRGDSCSETESTDISSNSSANLVKIDEEMGKHFGFKNENNPHPDAHVGHSHIIIEEDSVVKSVRGLLVVLALSIHELFEGLTVGLEASNANVWYMFGAVSVHKFVISFCIGVELVSMRTKTLLTVIYVFMFSVVSPLGIGIGILVTADDHDSTTLVSTILQGLATGTLLYVVFFEILQKDRSAGLKKYLSVLLGFLFMFGLTIFSGHDHAHGPPEHVGTEKYAHFH